METKTIRLTPAMANNWLSTNTINRPMRRTVVDGMVAAFKRGEYQLTHQGIAFADTGELLDGQHRLQAISEMPPTFACEMQVTRGMAKSVFKVIDKGLKRSHSDSLSIPAGHAAVARYLATIYETSRSGITTDYLIPYVKAVEAPYTRLTGFCSTLSRTWSSAALRSAAVLRLLDGGDADYICINYYALLHDEFDSMSPIVQSLYRQQVRGLVNVKGYDLFCRSWKAFDVKQQRLDKIQVNDHTATLARAREIILREVMGQRKAPTSGAKRVANSNDSKLVAA